VPGAPAAAGRGAGAATKPRAGVTAGRAAEAGPRGGCDAPGASGRWGPWLGGGAAAADAGRGTAPAPGGAPGYVRGCVPTTGVPVAGAAPAGPAGGNPLCAGPRSVAPGWAATRDPACAPAAGAAPGWAESARGPTGAG